MQVIFKIISSVCTDRDYTRERKHVIKHTNICFYMKHFLQAHDQKIQIITHTIRLCQKQKSHTKIQFKKYI